MHNSLQMTAALLLACSLHADADDSATQPISVQKTLTPLTINGDLSKPIWQSTTPIKVDYINSKKGMLSETPRMTVRYLWDDHYLYIGYEFFTKNLKAQGTGQREGPADNQREGAEISVKD